MGFTDMMQSGRGPGLVGTLVALLVLAGFGVLFLLALDDGGKGGKMSSAAVVQEQEKEISDLGMVLGQRKIEMGKLPGLEAKVRQLREATYQLNTAKSVAGANRKERDDSREKLDALGKEFVDYKQKYREFARLGAKGLEYPRLTTLSGKTYLEVRVREVTPAAMAIRHKDGFGSIPITDLPAEMQDHFQYDPGEAKAFLTASDAAEKARETAHASEMARLAVEREASSVAQEAARKNAAREAINTKTSQIATLDREYAGLRGAMEREMTKRVRNTQVIKEKMEANRASRAALEAEVNRLRNSL